MKNVRHLTDRTHTVDFPYFRLRVIVNTLLVGACALVLQNAFLDAADGFAFRAFYLPAFAARLGNIVLVAMIPAAVAVSILLYIYTTPIHRVLRSIHTGTRPPENLCTNALRRIVLYPYVVLVLNVAGFASGYLLFTSPAELATTRGVVLLLQNLVAGIVFGQAQIMINNLVLARPRRLLRVAYLEGLREPGIGQRNMLNTLSLCLYVAFTIIGVGQSIESEALAFSRANESVATGQQSLANAMSNYKHEVAVRRGVPQSLVQLPSNNFQARIATEVGIYSGMFLFIIAVGIFLQLLSSRAQVRQIKAVTQKLSEMAEGATDLTQRVMISQFDEIGELGDGINRVMSRLRDLFLHLAGAADRVNRSSETLNQVLSSAATGTEQMVASVAQTSRNATGQASIVSMAEDALAAMLDSIDSISANVDSQASFVEQTSSAITEMAANIRSVSQATAKANNVVSSLETVAQQGNEAVGNTTKAVHELESSSAAVNDVVTVIAKISAQTNLLAMNAAIEAAHAGKAGLGFAVVAEEVRNLAENSSSSAKAITTQIKEMSHLIESGVKLSQQAGQSLVRIRDGVSSTTGLVNEIAAAMNEQSAGAAQIVESMSSLVNSTQEIRKIAEEQKAGNLAMRKSVDALVRVFTEIRIAAEEQASGSKSIMDAIGNLQSVAGDNKDAIRTLHLLLQDFTFEGSDATPAIGSAG